MIQVFALSIICILVGSFWYVVGWLSNEESTTRTAWGISGLLFILGIIGVACTQKTILDDAHESCLVKYGIAEYYLDANHERQWRVLPEYEARYNENKAKEKK